jgi:hypothetical protein
MKQQQLIQSSFVGVKSVYRQSGAFDITIPPVIYFLLNI